MNTRQLQNNTELFQYLIGLEGELRSRGELELADEVLQSSQFASGSASEFLHEAHTVLTKVGKTGGQVLPRNELEEVLNVIRQIQKAFESVGGA